MTLDMRELAMACRCYGYGRWDAPYWFLGPEQGKGPAEGPENISRLQAWEKLGSPELCDCREFHALIGETAWHGDSPRLQKTWRPLMQLLLKFLGQPLDRHSSLNYQREQWGSRGGATCVIELAGLAARSLSVPIERQQFLEERVHTIADRIREYKPAFVLMYGMGQRDSWQEIADLQGVGMPLVVDTPVKVEDTVLVFAPHPVAHGRTNKQWDELARKLRLCGCLHR